MCHFGPLHLIFLKLPQTVCLTNCAILLHCLALLLLFLFLALCCHCRCTGCDGPEPWSCVCAVPWLGGTQLMGYQRPGQCSRLPEAPFPDASELFLTACVELHVPRSFVPFNFVFAPATCTLDWTRIHTLAYTNNLDSHT